MTMRVAHPFNTYRIALISGALTGPTSNLTWKIKIPFYPELHNGEAIETYVENSSGDVLKALTASTPKFRPCDDPRHPIPAGIQDEICLKNRLRKQWQVIRDPAWKAEVNRLQTSVTRRFNEWRNDQ